MMSLDIIDELIDHQITSRDLKNYPCRFPVIKKGSLVNLIHFMHNPPVAERQKQRAIVEKGFGDKNLEILFRACNFRLVFLHTFSRCSLKSSLLLIMTPKSFLEELFFIVIFNHLKMGKVLAVPSVTKNICQNSVQGSS